MMNHEMLLLRLVLSSTLIGLVALLAGWMLRRRPASTRVLVWQAVPITLLMGMLFGMMPVHLPWIGEMTMPGSHAFWLRGSIEPRVAAAPVTDQTQITPRNTGPIVVDAVEKTGPGMVPISSKISRTSDGVLNASVRRTEPVVAQGSSWRWRPWVVTIWASVASVLLVRWIINVIASQRLLRRATVIDPDIDYREFECRWVQSKDVDGPRIAGWWRSTIVLPMDWDRWSPEHQRMALEHERAHVFRRDLYWQRLSQLATCLAWFQPLVWHAHRRYQSEREMACDDHVIRSGSDPIAFAEFLLTLCTPQKRGFMGEGVGVTSPPIRGRVVSLLNRDVDRSSTPKTYRSVSVFVCCAVAMAIGLVRTEGSRRVAAQDAVAETTVVDSKPPKKMASLKLSVSDPHGLPAENVEADLFRWTGRQYQRLAETKRTDEQGNVVLDELPSKTWLYLFLRKPGFATGVLHWEYAKPAKREITFKLSHASQSKLELRDPDGNPVEGAQLRALQFTDQNGGKAHWGLEMPEEIGIRFSRSDADGVLELPALPTGAPLSLQVTHPDWQPLFVKEIEVTDGLISSLTMLPGVQLTIQVKPHGDEPQMDDGSKLRMTLLGDGVKAAAGQEVELHDGAISMTIPPADYQQLTIEGDQHFIGPARLSFPFARDDQMDMATKKSQEMVLTSWEKQRLQGRVVGVDGKGIPGVTVNAVSGAPEIVAKLRKILRGEGDPTDQALMQNEMRSVDFARTNKQGRFEIQAAAGTVCVSTEFPGYSVEGDFVSLDIEAESTRELPPMLLKSNESAKGKVLDSHGEPLAGAIVWLRGELAPHRTLVRTDANGAFDLPLEMVPRAALENQDDPSSSPDGGYFLVAIDPANREGGVLRLPGNPQKRGSLSISLKPQSNEWMLRPTAKESSVDPAVQEAWLEHVAEQKEKYPDGIPGNSVPAMREGTWFNSDATSLDDFRGRFVLLDFWFIGCGPCHAEMPEVRLLQESFPQDKFVVVGMHTNAQTPQSVEAFLNESGISFPVVVDGTQGIISKEYSLLGVDTYPSYLLIDPEGKIVHNDAVAQQHFMRVQKVELIRNAIQSWDWSGASRSSER